jgi:hypothetical protein
MSSESGRRTALWRAVAVLALAGIVGGALAAGPAGAAKFLTKKKGNKLFLSPAEGNALYIEDRVIYRRGPSVQIADGDDQPLQAACPTGAKAIGGGFYAEFDDMFASSSFASDPANNGLTGFTAWTTWVENNSGSAGDATPYVVCLNAATVDADYPAGQFPLVNV